MIELKDLMGGRESVPEKLRTEEGYYDDQRECFDFGYHQGKCLWHHVGLNNGEHNYCTVENEWKECPYVKD
jgi:hypothetical protein